MVRILRSFPNETPPPGRGYVCDEIERFPQPAFDYTGLKNYGDDLVILEWDIAVSALDLARFAGRVSGLQWPMVAPFRNRINGQLMHWRSEPVALGESFRPIYQGEPDCDLFGFGLVYLPWWVIRDYPLGYGGSSMMSDGSLPRWMRGHAGWKPIPVDWTTTAVHIS